jgi:hypothetical protein
MVDNKWTLSHRIERLRLNNITPLPNLSKNLTKVLASFTGIQYVNEINGEAISTVIKQTDLNIDVNTLFYELRNAINEVKHKL